jgi:hypothetical protein
LSSILSVSGSSEASRDADPTGRSQWKIRRKKRVDRREKIMHSSAGFSLSSLFSQLSSAYTEERREWIEERK